MHAEKLAHALGATRSGRQWKCRCVAHQDAAPSMIVFNGRERVQVRCLAGCEPADIIAVLKARGLWGEGHSRQHEGSKWTEQIESPMSEPARRIFAAARGIKGSLAEEYFARRHIREAALASHDVRFHPACPREGERLPAVVIAMRDFGSNAVVGIQRLFLTADAHKSGRGMMLGRAGSAAMKLQRVLSPELHIAEGLETALSVIAMNHGPIWALGSAGSIRTLPVFEGVERLVIWADHDRADPRTGRRAGVEAADICAARWRAAGRRVKVWLPEKEDWDAADVWSNRCAG
jgi:putative DNA primase/helicase